MNVLFFVLIAIYIIAALVIIRRGAARLISPQFIFVAMYIISFLCCAVNIGLWGVDFSLMTLVIYTIGLAITIAVGLIFWRKNKAATEINKLKHIEFKIPKWLYVTMLFTSVVVLLLVIANVWSIAAKYDGVSSISQALYTYKKYANYSNVEILHPAIRLLKKLILANGYIAIFSLSSNVFSSQRKKGIFKNLCTNLANIILITIVPVLYLAQSDRGSIISFALSSLVVFALFAIYAGKFTKKALLKIVPAGIISGVVISGLFFIAAPMIGRVNNLNFINYTTMYLGGSIDSFDLSVKEYHDYPGSQYPGEHVFSYLYQDLDKMGIVEYRPANIGPTRYNGDKFIGNVYTGYQAWYYDFGLVGVIVFMAIFMLIETYLYKKSLSSKRYPSRIIFIFSYAYFTKWLLYHSIYGGFPKDIICRAGMLDFIFIAVPLFLVSIYNSRRGNELNSAAGDKAIDNNGATKAPKKLTNEQKVSVIIPVHNGADTIRGCIDSLISQTYPNIEVVVIDDGSSDSTSDIIKSYSSDVVKYYSQKNKGVSSARNLGSMKATGGYVMFMDADDTCSPNMVTEMVASARKKHVPIVRCGVKEIRGKEEKAFFPEDLSNTTIDTRSPEEREKLYDHLFRDGADIKCLVMALLVDSKIAKKISFDEEMSMMEDVDYYMNLIKMGEKIYFLDRPLYNYYIRKESATHSRENYEKMARGVLLANSKMNAALGHDMKINNMHFRILFYYMAKSGTKNRELVRGCSDLAKNTDFSGGPLFWRMASGFYAGENKIGQIISRRVFIIKNIIKRII